MPDGVLVIDKPSGPTSHDVVYQARRLFHDKVGHTGTLDPLATGVLVLVIGQATRLSRFFQCDEKEYLADIRLGIATDTYDREGRVLEEKQVPVLEDSALNSLLARFLGRFSQIPPAYSAVKVGGKKLYERARKQEHVDPPAREVEVRRLELIEHNGETVRVAVLCSAGTYIRSLAHDIGRALGCGAHLSDLRRTKAGVFDLSRAVPLSALPNWGPQMLIPLGQLLPDLPRLDLAAATAERVRHGNSFSFAAPTGFCRLFEDEHLLAIAQSDGNVVQPKVVLQGQG